MFGLHMSIKELIIKQAELETFSYKSTIVSLKIILQRRHFAVKNAIGFRSFRTKFVFDFFWRDAFDVSSSTPMNSSVTNSCRIQQLDVFCKIAGGNLIQPSAIYDWENFTFVILSQFTSLVFPLLHLVEIKSVFEFITSN